MMQILPISQQNGEPNTSRNRWFLSRSAVLVFWNESLPPPFYSDAGKAWHFTQGSVFAALAPLVTGLHRFAFQRLLAFSRSDGVDLLALRVRACGGSSSGLLPSLEIMTLAVTVLPPSSFTT